MRTMHVLMRVRKMQSELHSRPYITFYGMFVLGSYSSLSLKNNKHNLIPFLTVD